MIFSSDIRACFSLERAVAETGITLITTSIGQLGFFLKKNKKLKRVCFIQLTLEHLYCHLHDRLRAAEAVGGALYHFPEGSRAQDTTF